MSELLSAVKDTPLPTILVVAGIFFWLLAIAGTLAGKITVQPAHQWMAGLVGTVFIGLGLLTYFTPTSLLGLGGKEAAAAAPHPPTQNNTPQPSTQIDLPLSASRKPSFNCATDHEPDEVAICNNGTLSNLDLQLADLYRTLSDRLGKNQKARLIEEQRAWVQQRRSCQSNEPCLTKTYEARIAQLQSWH